MERNDYPPIPIPTPHAPPPPRSSTAAMKYVISLTCATCGKTAICAALDKLPDLPLSEPSWLTIRRHAFKGDPIMEHAFCSPRCAGEAISLLAAEEDARQERIRAARQREEVLS
jgi:hypothetical protein